MDKPETQHSHFLKPENVTERNERVFVFVSNPFSPLIARAQCFLGLSPDAKLLTLNSSIQHEVILRNVFFPTFCVENAKF